NDQQGSVLRVSCGIQVSLKLVNKDYFNSIIQRTIYFYRFWHHVGRPTGRGMHFRLQQQRTYQWALPFTEFPWVLSGERCLQLLLLCRQRRKSCPAFHLL
ncbi:GL20579, partial [Drosophila persimilis]